MRNCLTNTKGLVKIEMQINSTKSDSDFSVVHIYRKLQEKISFLLSLDNEKSDFIGLFCFRKKAVWQTQRIGTPAVSLRNKHSLRQIPLCIIAIFVTIEFGIEVDFDVELFIFLGDDDAVYQQPKISVADSSLLNDLLN